MKITILSFFLIFSVLLLPGLDFAEAAKASGTSIPRTGVELCGDRLCSEGEELTPQEKIAFYLLSLIEFEDSTVIQQGRFSVGGVAQQSSGFFSGTNQVSLGQFSTNSIMDKGVLNSMAVPIKEPTLQFQPIAPSIGKPFPVTPEFGSIPAAEIKIEQPTVAVKRFNIGTLEPQKYERIIDKGQIISGKIDTSQLSILCVINCPEDYFGKVVNDPIDPIIVKSYGDKILEQYGGDFQSESDIFKAESNSFTNLDLYDPEIINKLQVDESILNKLRNAQLSMKNFENEPSTILIKFPPDTSALEEKFSEMCSKEPGETTFYYGCDLTGRYFNNKDLSGYIFSHANLTNVNLSNSNLTNTSFVNANLEGTKIIDSEIKNANFYGADLTNSNMRVSDLSGSNFENTKMINANLNLVKAHGTSFYGSDLSGANLVYADLVGSNFGNAKLSDADLHLSRITFTSFINADMQRVNLQGLSTGSCIEDYSQEYCSNFNNGYLVNFNGANMRYVDASPINASPDGTPLDETKPILYTILVYADYRNADMSYSDFRFVQGGLSDYENTKLVDTDWYGRWDAGSNLRYGLHFKDSDLRKSVWNFLNAYWQDITFENTVCAGSWADDGRGGMAKMYGTMDPIPFCIDT